MFTRTASRLHGLIRLPCGKGELVLGRTVQMMEPCNEIYYDPVRLRARLDRDGYLYLRGFIPRETIAGSMGGLRKYLEDVGLTLPLSYTYNVDFDPTGAYSRSSPEEAEAATNAVLDATTGSKVMSGVRQVYSAPVEAMAHRSLEVSPPGEEHSFHMDSVFGSKSTKLSLAAWVPLVDTPLKAGGLVLLKGSNHHASTEKIRNTYAQMDAHAGDIQGGGMLTSNPLDLADLADGFVTSSYGCGDVVLYTAYTMHGFLTNTTRNVRLSTESRWYLKGDDVGPDPRTRGHYCPKAKEGARTMEEAVKEWGI
eukprot:PhM_4_TR17874/c0_g1_i1/m.11061